MKAIQFIETLGQNDHAEQILDSIKFQEGFIGGRILKGHRIQFFMTIGEREKGIAEFDNALALVGGKVVFIMESQKKALGIS